MNMRYAKRSEDTEQINVVSWAGWNMNRYPELKWLFHVPNGGSRNKQEAVKFKQMGVKAGVSDLCLPYPKGSYCGLFVEMKFGNNRQQDTQKEFLADMAEKNMIEYDGQEIRTNVTRKYSGEQTQTPIVGSIPCGSPQYEEENIEEYVSLPTAIFGKGDFFILRASGQSMIEAGIDDGDLVVVKKQVEANEGDIVVALVDNQNTLKRYFRDDENKKIILHPENKKMKDIIVDECCIQGVACHIIKEL